MKNFIYYSLVLLVLVFIAFFCIKRSNERYKVTISNSIGAFGAYVIKSEKGQSKESLEQLAGAICKTSGPNCTWTISKDN